MRGRIGIGSFWARARLAGYLFIAPNVLLFFFLTVFPVVFSFLLAFFGFPVSLSQRSSVK